VSIESSQTWELKSHHAHYPELPTPPAGFDTVLIQLTAISNRVPIFPQLKTKMRDRLTEASTAFAYDRFGRLYFFLQ
jgi:hypothetical protein